MVAVITVQPVLGAEPHESLPVLQYANNAPLRESLLHRKVIEYDLVLGLQCDGENEQQNDHQRASPRATTDRILPP